METYDVFVKGITGVSKVIRVKQDSTVTDLLCKISEWNRIPVHEQRVVFSNKMLKTEKDGTSRRLADYGVTDKSTLFIVVPLKGGQDSRPPRSPIPSGSLYRTVRQDMITLDQDPDHKCVRMSCGHAIGAESLWNYCKTFILDKGHFQFPCPTRYCAGVWDYTEIRRKAALTAEEMTEFETKISENYARKRMGVQECPKCISLCERMDTRNKRVVCPVCSQPGKRFEFCWCCLGEWRTLGTSTCGNPACREEDSRLGYLRDCPLKEIVGLPGCPSLRACPGCGFLIEHTSACKQMTCRSCEQKFCFICLTKGNKAGLYQCGSYNSHCKIAPIQTELPGEH